jgi:hypothetical protein
MLIEFLADDSPGASGVQRPQAHLESGFWRERFEERI